jgi:N-carbamoyl-L-amino-acid hydrolase
MHAMLELHIEQGPILEAEGKDIGVVTHGQGLWWLEITLTGKDAHTGSTPMRMRVNAGLGMARITERVHQIAMSHQPNAVGAVGQVKVFPNSRNVIPGKVVFTVDIRSPEQAKLDTMKGEVMRAAHAVAAELDIGLSHMDIVSGAGHDACWVNRVAPTVMIMCPCVDGLSHNEAENISPEWAAAGTDVLLHAVLDVAEVVS